MGITPFLLHRRGGALLRPKTPDSCIFSGKFLTWQTATGRAEPRPYAYAMAALSRTFPIKAVNFPLLRIFVYVLPNPLIVWLITDNVFIVTALPELAARCLHSLIGGLCGK